MEIRVRLQYVQISAFFQCLTNSPFLFGCHILTKTRLFKLRAVAAGKGKA
jgi:hypothetical protein